MLGKLLFNLMMLLFILLVITLPWLLVMMKMADFQS